MEVLGAGLTNAINNVRAALVGCEVLYHEHAAVEAYFKEVLAAGLTMQSIFIIALSI